VGGSWLVFFPVSSADPIESEMIFILSAPSEFCLLLSVFPLFELVKPASLPADQRSQACPIPHWLALNYQLTTDNYPKCQLIRVEMAGLSFISVEFVKAFGSCVFPF
jgi:hypothetical protein